VTADPPDRDRSRAELDWLNRLFDLPASEREAQLADLTVRDAGMANAIRRLLSSADAMESSEATSDDTDDAEHIVPGTLIGGRFRVLRALGSGGMGEVFLAQRTDEIEHCVAIKVLHDGGRAMARARARREQQILAKLSHPNIAGLIDAGVAEDKRPWFAMDYVDGERLLPWCDHRRSSIADRVRRFVSICGAVQFAHKNLILHRDLKPSNILVNNEGVPKLLDFGIAKVMDVNQTDETRTLAMTPAYAAPEQLRGEPTTTASDIYQLGSVLYELVSGVSVQEARNAAMRNADTITELPWPHQALAMRLVGDRVATEQMTHERSVSPDRLVRLLKGDLGRIVAKATAQRPADRYDTAQALADDLERWLAGLPVHAHRQSLGYSIGKLLRRHAWAAAAIIALSIGLIAATIVAFNKAISERQQREQADAQRREAEQQRDLARSQRERSEAMAGFLRNVFQQADPDVSGGDDVRAPELLARAQAELDRRADVDDLTRAGLLTELASAFSNLGQPQVALAPAERAIELLEPQREQHTTEYLDSLAVLLLVDNFLGRYQDAFDRIGKALPLAQREGAGEKKTSTYATLLTRRSSILSNLGRAAEAEADAREVLAISEDNSENALEALNLLAITQNLQSHYTDAETTLRRIIDLDGRDPPVVKSRVLSAKLNLAVSLRGSGRVREAIALLEPVTAQTEAAFGASHLATLMGKMLLLQCHLAAGDPLRARVVFEQLQAASKVADRQFARAQGFVTTGMLNYELAVGRFGQAAKLARNFLKATPGKTRVDSRRHADIWRLLGEAQLQLGQPEQARRTFEAVMDETKSGEIVRRATLEDGIGRTRIAGGEPSAAVEPLHRAAEAFRGIQGADKPAVLRSEIHELWARALATREARFLHRLQEKRAALVAALGGEDKLQVWQFDRMLDALCRRLGRPGIEAGRRTRAEAGLRRIAGTAKPAVYVGISEF